MFIREIFKEHYDITDSMAKNMLDILQPTLEEELGINFEGSHLHGRSRILPYMNNRHPHSITEKPNPFISIGFTTDVEYTDGVFSASTFRTDVASYIDPEVFTDVFLENSDRLDQSKNLEVRLAFDNVDMNCDIALLFDTPARQLQCKRVWEVLYETGREYEVNMTVKAPISEKIIKLWSSIFNIDINDLDGILAHMQNRSEFLLTREVRTLTGKETLYFNYQCRSRLKYERIESSSTDEHGNTSMARVIARLVNIRFNAPSIYYIRSKDVTNNIPIENGGTVNGDVQIHTDRVSDTFEDMNCIYHEPFVFDTNIKKIGELLSDYYNFLEWTFNRYGTYDKAVNILIRDTSNPANKESKVSSDCVDIGYKSLTLRLKENTLLNKPFDLRVYLNAHIHSIYMQERSIQETINSNIDIIDIAQTEDDILSDALKNMIK